MLETTLIANMMLDLPGFDRALNGSRWDWLTDPIVIGCILAALGTSAMIAWYLAAVKRDRALQGPAFRAMTRAAGLNSAQQRLLIEMARIASVPVPATLLVSAGYFDHTVRTLGEHSLDRGQIQLIRDELFRSVLGPR